MNRSVGLDFKFVLKAVRFEDLMLPGEDRDKAFTRLAKIYHPDKHKGSDIARAEEVFKHINALHQGTTKPPVTIGKYTIRDPFMRGAIADLYLTECGNVFKIARSKSDNDLLDRESAALKKLAQEGDDKHDFAHYVPALIETFTASMRRVNVIRYHPDYIPLSDIANRLGGTIEFRHGVWMMNRLLSVMGWAHHRGIVHGAIVPSHLLYRPRDHDLALVDWCYSAAPGEKVIAVDSEYKTQYPKEVLAKRPAGVGTDVYMAAKTIRSLMKTVPKRFEPVFEWALCEAPGARPSAWTLQDRWRAAAKAEYGEPKFIHLELPVH